MAEPKFKKEILKDGTEVVTLIKESPTGKSGEKAETKSQPPKESGDKEKIK